MDEQNNRNYILKHRKILKNPIYKKPLVAHLFDYCLLMANYAEKKMIWNNKEMIIERGSFITGRKIIADETGLSEQNVRSGLHTLYMMGMLQKSTTKSTNRFTYLTVCKYNDYQIIKDEANQETNQPATSSQPASNQQPTTTKKDKKEKNEEKDKNLHTQSADESAAYSVEFSAWWSDWIKSISRGTGGKKQKAFEYFKRLKKTFTTQQIRDATANYMSSCRNTGSYHKDAEGFLSPSNGLVKQWYETQPVEGATTAPRNQTTSSQLDDIFNRKSEEHNGIGNTESYSQDTAGNNPAIQAAIG